MKVTNLRYLSLFEKHGNPEKPRKELKLKSAKQLSDILNVTKELIDLLEEQDAVGDSGDECENLDKLYQMRTVQMHGEFRNKSKVR